jgi:HEAT repeat protein
MKTTIACIAGVWIAAAAFAAPVSSIDAYEKEKEKQEARVEKEQDLYEEGTDALDDHDWRRAAKSFEKVVAMRMSHADAATYWLAYAQNKTGQRAEALDTLLALQKNYPQSKWVRDGKQLELEIRQGSGQQINPKGVDDEDLKLMAINGLMQTDPEQAVPILEHLLNSSQSAKIKDRALFVLSQSSSQKAYEVLSRVAKGGRPELQSRAIRYLGISGGERNRGLLADIYNSSNDVAIKKSVLKSYMISGDRARVLTLAKSETNPELRAEAVTQLGVMGARNELSELYSSETDVNVRKKIIQAMFIGGSADKLAEIARSEPVLELKLTAIKNLGLLGGKSSGTELLSLYRSDNRQEVREQIIKAFFIQNNAKQLVELARTEKDPELKREIVSKLSLMRSKEATDYLLEYLKD